MAWEYTGCFTICRRNFRSKFRTLKWEKSWYKCILDTISFLSHSFCLPVIFTINWALFWALFYVRILLAAYSQEFITNLNNTLYFQIDKFYDKVIKSLHSNRRYLFWNTLWIVELFQSKALKRFFSNSWILAARCFRGSTLPREYRRNGNKGRET